MPAGLRSRRARGGMPVRGALSSGGITRGDAAALDLGVGLLDGRDGGDDGQPRDGVGELPTRDAVLRRGEAWRGVARRGEVEQARGKVWPYPGGRRGKGARRGPWQW